MCNWYIFQINCPALADNDANYKLMEKFEMSKKLKYENLLSVHESNIPPYPKSIVYDFNFRGTLIPTCSHSQHITYSSLVCALMLGNLALWVNL